MIKGANQAFIHRTIVSKTVFWVCLLVVGSVLLTFALTHAYVGDESFHLLAAKLIAAGKRPYVDFFYQHPPLFTCLSAALMRIFGSGWRGTHLFSTLLLIGSIIFAAAYARSFFAEQRYAWFCAALVPILIGLNCYVLVFATTGLPFGFCLFCLSAALYFCLRDTTKTAVIAGVFAAAAVASNFLTLPALLIFFFWFCQRGKKSALLFTVGALCALSPLLVFLLVWPKQVVFNLVEYHLYYRPSLGWRFNLHETAVWLFSIQGVTLSVAAVSCFWFRKDPPVRLCGAVALALGVVTASVKTTSAFYFLLLTPFLAILAAVATTELTQRFRQQGNFIVLGTLALYLVGMLGLKYVWRWQAPYTDHRMVNTALERLESCAPDGDFYAIEAIYFEGSHLPPPGMENRFDPNFTGNQLLAEGRVKALLIGATNPAIEKFDLEKRYPIYAPLENDSDWLIFCR